MKSKTKRKTFITQGGLELIVESRKTAVSFYMNPSQLPNKSQMVFDFDPADFDEFVTYIEQVADESWILLNPGEAKNAGSDYWEYYDRELDNNGYLTVRACRLSISRPVDDNPKMYQFNKKKMESFLYDIAKLNREVLSGLEH